MEDQLDGTRGRRPVASELHPLIDAAGRGSALPDWARCTDPRYQHSVRVGDLLGRWAKKLGLAEADAVRWRAAGVLHDALKDAPDEELHELAGVGWPPAVAHAPACAARLELDGVEDRPLLDAIAYHPVGHPDLDDLGEYLILADYLEPGRSHLKAKHTRLRDRLPADRSAVLTEVLAARLQRLLAKESTILASTVDHWNRLVGR